MKYKLSLSSFEYRVVMRFMSAIDLRENLSRREERDLLVIANLKALYSKLFAVVLSDRVKYNFSIPIEHALAFKLYWTGKPLGDDSTSAKVINKLIGEIDKAVVNIQATNRF